MLNKALQHQSIMNDIPTAQEIAKKLSSEIYDRRFEFEDSYEFEYVSGNYVFQLDVDTYYHSKVFEITDSYMTCGENEVDCIELTEEVILLTEKYL